MREKQLLNKRWHCHEVVGENESAKHSVAGMYISAKTKMKVHREASLGLLPKTKKYEVQK